METRTRHKPPVAPGLDFQTLLESGPDFVAVVDRDGCIRYISPAITRVGGYLQDDLIGKRFSDFIHPEDRPKAAQNFLGLLKQPSGQVLAGTHRYRHKDGSWHFIETLSRNDLDDPAVQGVIINTRDITDRVQAVESLRRVTRARNALLVASTAVSHAVDEASLLNTICKVAVEIGYRMAWVGIADRNHVVTPAAYAGVEAGYLKRAQVRWDDSERGQGPTGAAIRTGKIQINQNMLTNPRMQPWRADAAARGFASSVGLPLTDEQGSFGALTLYAAEPDAFNADEMQLLEQLAKELSHGIQGIRLRTKSAHQQRLLRSALEGSIQAIAGTLEKRDPYTAGHQRRVAELSSAIARELGLPEEDVHGLHLAATIHDLGKIQIPAEILTKPGRLTTLEFELMKLHPQAGYDIVKDIEFPWPVAQIILQHHERMDGSGYPGGLKGDQILLQARIVGVADVVEAMASHRPYRAALGIDAALEEISKFRGTRYDPEVVSACLRLFAAKNFSFG